MTNIKEIISWDCANKTLGWSHVTINCDIITTLINLKSQIVDIREQLAMINGHILNNPEISTLTDQLSQLTQLTQQAADINHQIDFIKFHSGGVFDTLCGKKLAEVSDFEKSNTLHMFLKRQFANVTPTTLVFIEHQPLKLNFQGMKFNGRPDAAYVEHQLIFYFSQFTSNIIQVDSGLRKRLCLGPNLTYDYFLTQGLQKYKKEKDAKYWASKEHSKQNFLALLSTFNQMDVIRDTPKASLDDQADSATQMLAYLSLQKMFC